MPAATTAAAVRPRGGSESDAGDATCDVGRPTEDGDCGGGEMATAALTMPPISTGRTTGSRSAAAAEAIWRREGRCGQGQRQQRRRPRPLLEAATNIHFLSDKVNKK